MTDKHVKPGLFLRCVVLERDPDGTRGRIVFEPINLPMQPDGIGQIDLPVRNIEGFLDYFIVGVTYEFTPQSIYEPEYNMSIPLP